jgi:hypothetical protein
MIQPHASKAIVTLALLGMTLGSAASFSLAQQPEQRQDDQRPGKGPGKQGRRGGAGGGAAAGGQAAAPKENPFAGPEDQKILTLAGAWREDVRYAGDAEDNPSGKGRWLARPMFGLYLILNYEGMGPEGDYHAHGVMAYDHEDRAYRLWWFDDAGGIGEYTGAWKDENTMVFEHKKNSGGRPFRERITYTHASADAVDTKVEQAWGTEPYKFYMAASAQRAQWQEGKGWGERLAQQQPLPRRSPSNPPDAAPPKQAKPPR